MHMHRAAALADRGRRIHAPIRKPRHENDNNYDDVDDDDDVWIWMRLLLKHLDFLQLYTAALKQIMSERIAD